MHGYQCAQWSGLGGDPTNSKGRVSVYKCDKCALLFDKPDRFKDSLQSFSWCPCCKSPNIKFVETVAVGSKQYKKVMISNSYDDLENMAMLDIFLDGQLDAGFFI